MNLKICGIILIYILNVCNFISYLLMLERWVLLV